MLIASWNINSVRRRLRALGQFVRKYRPDVLCLQETKVEDDLFPVERMRKLGFHHTVFCGDKGYNGMAIASVHPITKSWRHDVGRTDQARHQAAVIRGIELHNLYVPAGGDIPDPERNPKFGRKLAFMRSAARWMRGWKPRAARIIVGDFNVAPLETDVWSHQKLKRSMTHTPVEIARLREMQRAGKWVDAARIFVPPTQSLFTWWSYRAPNFRRPNRGRRLDHIWVSEDLTNQLSSFEVAEEVRGWKWPSDHAPLLLRLAPPQ